MISAILSYISPWFSASFLNVLFWPLIRHKNSWTWEPSVHNAVLELKYSIWSSNPDILPAEPMVLQKNHTEVVWSIENYPKESLFMPFDTAARSTHSGFFTYVACMSHQCQVNIHCMIFTSKSTFSTYYSKWIQIHTTAELFSWSFRMLSSSSVSLLLKSKLANWVRLEKQGFIKDKTDTTGKTVVRIREGRKKKSSSRIKYFPHTTKFSACYS